jgi:hypothetical protein
VEIQSPPKIKFQKQIPLVKIVRSTRGSKEWNGSGVPVVGVHIGVEWRGVEAAMKRTRVREEERISNRSPPTPHINRLCNRSSFRLN